MDKIKGIIERVLKKDPETGAVFLLVQYEGREGLVGTKVAGYARWVRAGDCFNATGEWKNSVYHGRMEKNFKADHILPDLPSSPAAMRFFLLKIFDAERFVIEEEKVDELIKTYGTGLLDELRANPSLLLPADKRHLGTALVEELATRTQGKAMAAIIRSTGVTRDVVDAIINAVPLTTSMNLLHSNPWRVARIDDVGFDNSDIIGLHLGFSRNDSRRLNEAVVAVLKSQASQGSTAANLASLLGGMSRRSKIGYNQLVDFLQSVIAARSDDIIAIQANNSVLVSTWPTFRAEVAISNYVKNTIAARPGRVTPVSLPDGPTKKMDASQKQAVATALSEPISIITGGPGTGKSTILKMVADLYEKQRGTAPLLAAPTGKAAKRLEEAAGRHATTVHRLLRASLEADGRTRFAYNEQTPLPSGSVVIIDESSMLDSEMAGALIQAMPPDGRLVLVGDKNQLPSVGPGAVLSDLMAERDIAEVRIPKVELTKVYRQSGDSAIASGAALIRDGVTPKMHEHDVGGVSFREVDDELIGETIEDIIRDELKGDDFDRFRDVVVLSPMAPGNGGTWDLNRRLSAMLNRRTNSAIPGLIKAAKDKRDMPIPRIGDRIMLTENDSANDVMNGDTGVITGSGQDERGRPTIRVQFDCQKTAEYPVGRWRILIPAYAMTIHKSQGSQYPVVIMPFSRAHMSMMERSLIYTGWTRAQSRLILVGNRKVFEAGIGNPGAKRDTMLDYFMSKRELMEFDFSGRGLRSARAPEAPRQSVRHIRSLIFNKRRREEEANRPAFGASFEKPPARSVSRQKRNRLFAPSPAIVQAQENASQPNTAMAREFERYRKAAAPQGGHGQQTDQGPVGPTDYVATVTASPAARTRLFTKKKKHIDHEFEDAKPAPKGP